MNKDSGGDRIPVEPFKFLKDNAVKVLSLICQQTWKTQQEHRARTSQFSLQIPKNGNAKECANYYVLISHASKVMPKIF